MIGIGFVLIISYTLFHVIVITVMNGIGFVLIISYISDAVPTENPV